MSLQKWQTAINRYRQSSTLAKEAKVAAQLVKEASVMQKLNELHERTIDMARASDELSGFLMINGLIINDLLEASGRHIIFGEDYAGGGFGVVYFLGPNGLQQSVEPMGTWMAYSRNVPKPVLSVILPYQAIDAAVNLGGKNPKDIIIWLQEELDKIADAVLNPS